MTELGLPPRIIVGANGAYWRDYDTHRSMCPVSADNDPIEVVATYVPETEIARLVGQLEAADAKLAECEEEIERLRKQAKTAEAENDRLREAIERALGVLKEAIWRRDDELDRLREELDAKHLHSEWGPFGYAGRSALRWARIGKGGCPTCELIGRPEHRHDASCRGTGALG